ncbi:MAG: hypothetical protein MUC49_05505 [Raineya sp.]|jgi:hypothetical protein|nr:hypothetical protein [Raineya sp.]
MKLRILLIACLFTFFQKANAQKLAYQWKEGAIYRFTATQTDEISSSGSVSGMEMISMMQSTVPTMKFTTKSTFALKINSKTSNGGAKGTFYLENFNVTDDKKRVIATVSNLPKSSVEADFLVDDQGNFTFLETPFLVVREGGSILVEAKVKEGGIAASAEVDGEKLSVMAEFNPKTGQLKAGYTVTTINKPKPKTVEIKETDNTIDLIPTDFIDLLQLPQNTTVGEENKMSMMGMEVIQKVNSFTNQQASIKLNLKSSIDAQKIEKDTKLEEDDKEMLAPQMGQTMVADFNYLFDNKIGMLNNISGNITTIQKMMGMEIKHIGTLEMKPVK